MFQNRAFGKSTQLAFVVLFILALWPINAAAQTAGIAVGSASGLPGATVTIPLEFAANGTSVSTLQFDLLFSSAISYSSISTGTAASNASKSASANAISGGIRVLIFGMNTNVMSSGNIASIQFAISGSASVGTAPITISGIVASDPNAVAVSSGGTAGAIQVAAPADTTPPTISSVSSSSITGTTATITWTTNESADTQVEYGTTTGYGSSTTLNSTLTTSHSQSLSGLTGGTLYHYRVKSKDASNNPATSNDYTFTTSDTTAPTISSVSSSSITGTTATITWTTSEAADTQVEYGTTTGYGSSTTLNGTLTTSHSQSLSGLSSGTLYHYRVKSKDASNNPATSNDYTFTTSDTTAPTISSVSSSSITGTTATITWTTSEAADTQVEYGTTTGYGSSTTLNSTLTTSHSQSLSGLTGGTLYHYRVKSKDASNNPATSNDYTFTTSDTTAPTISSVASSSITGTTATITWTTSEAADTQVEYGTTTGYGSSTTLNSTLTTSHSQSLSGLTGGTLYHYRVKSKDASNNPATSGDYTFTTSDTTAPTISAVASSSISNSAATITWTTNEASDSQVEYGTTTGYGSSSSLAGSRVTAHSQGLTGLTASTLYHYRVRSKDASGNLAISGDYSFTTTAVPDTAAPVISSVGASGITSSAATITWSTNEAADSQVEYGTTTGYGSSTTLDSTLATAHSQSLSGLAGSTLYHYRVKSKDAAGNPSTSGDFTFTTTAQPDTTAPVISAVTSSNLTGSSATITWTTSEAADSQVEYGTTTGYGSSTALDTTLATAHSQGLSGLAGSTLYHYRVKSKDAAGNPATSGDFTFTTTAVPDTTAPVISEVTASSVKSTSATISWSTNEAADSQVEYGTTTGYGSSTSLNSALATSHMQALTGLSADTLYHYRVKSADAAGNQAVSPDYTFTTNKGGTVPVISNIEVSDITNRSATISWTTDVSADSRVEFWLANQPVQLSGLGDMVTRHSLTLNDLQRSSQYRYIIKSADAEGNQAVSSEDAFTTRGNGELVFALPRFASSAQGNNENENLIGMAIANMGTEQASLTFTAVDSDGNLINGAGIVNPATLQLNPGSQMAILDFEIFGEGFAADPRDGWIKVESADPNIIGFYLGFDGGNKEMDGASFGYMPLNDFILSEIEPNGSTKINLANTTGDNATVAINLMKADGSIRSTQSRSINGDGAFVADLYGDLFVGIQPDPTDYVLVRSTQGLRSFEMMKPDAGDMASLSGQDLTAGGTILYSPQYAMGGSWKTGLSVVNLDSRPGMVTLQLLGEDGVQIGSSRAVQLDAYGKIWIDDPNFFAPLDSDTVTIGYIRIESDGIRLVGSTVYRNRNGQSFSSALPLVYNLKTAVTFSQVASNDMYFTGIALLNPNQTDASVDIRIYSEDGQLIDQKVETIPSMRKIAKLVTEFFPSLAGQNRTSGYVRVTSSKPVVSFSLLGTNDLTVLSAIPGQ